MFSSSRLYVYLCDDGASYPPIEFGLDVEFDPPLTTSSLVAPSSPSTLRDSNTFDITLLDRPLPLAQSMEFVVGETFNVKTSVDENDTYYESNNFFI